MPLRIPVPRKKRPEDLAAASPINKSRKYEALPSVTQKKEHILFDLLFILELQSTQNVEDKLRGNDILAGSKDCLRFASGGEYFVDCLFQGIHPIRLLNEPLAATVKDLLGLSIHAVST